MCLIMLSAFYLKSERERLLEALVSGSNNTEDSIPTFRCQRIGKARSVQQGLESSALGLVASKTLASADRWYSP